MSVDSNLVIPGLLVIANVLGVGMIVPQVLRLRSHRSAAGVSCEWIGVGLAMNLWWIGYGVSQGLWGMVPVSVGGAVLYTVIAIQLSHLAGPLATRNVARGALAIASVPAGFLVLSGWEAAGLAIGLIYGIQFAPATVAALRSSDLSGVSSSTWIMALGEAVIWVIYGWNQADLALIVGGLGGTIMSATTLVRLARASCGTQLLERIATRKSDSDVNGWMSHVDSSRRRRRPAALASAKKSSNS